MSSLVSGFVGEASMHIVAHLKEEQLQVFRVVLCMPCPLSIGKFWLIRTLRKLANRVLNSYLAESETNSLYFHFGGK